MSRAIITRSTVQSKAKHQFNGISVYRDLCAVIAYNSTMFKQTIDTFRKAYFQFALLGVGWPKSL